jgi:hypothetical protein
MARGAFGEGQHAGRASPRGNGRASITGGASPCGTVLNRTGAGFTVRKEQMSRACGS